jgi:peptide deformylase
MTATHRTHSLVGAVSLADQLERLERLRGDDTASDRFTLRLLGDWPLKEKAKPVTPDNPPAPGLVAALQREMTRFHGLGMSAQQVGSTQAVCVCRLSFKSGMGGPRSPIVMLNPRVVDQSPNTVVCVQEGCLSVPGFRTSVRRHPWIVVEYDTPAFERKRERLVDLDAQIVQHELDHLAGRCIADRVSRQQRRQAEKLVERARTRL